MQVHSVQSSVVEDLEINVRLYILYLITHSNRFIIDHQKGHVAPFFNLVYDNVNKRSVRESVSKNMILKLDEAHDFNTGYNDIVNDIMKNYREYENDSYTSLDYESKMAGIFHKCGTCKHCRPHDIVPMAVECMLRRQFDGSIGQPPPDVFLYEAFGARGTLRPPYCDYEFSDDSVFNNMYKMYNEDIKPKFQLF